MRLQQLPWKHEIFKLSFKCDISHEWSCKHYPWKNDFLLKLTSFSVADWSKALAYELLYFWLRIPLEQNLEQKTIVSFRKVGGLFRGLRVFHHPETGHHGYKLWR